MPRDRLNRVRVALERVEFLLQVTQIPDGDGLVCGTSSQNGLRGRVEGKRIDGIAVLALSGGGRASGVILAGIENLERDIIGNSSDERGVKRVILNVIDNRGVVSEGTAGSDGLVALGVCSDVPVVDG